MKILSADQIRETDAYTIRHEPIASIDLMERAAASFTAWLVGSFSVDKSIVIVCGRGNNGGDGLAVARMLIDKGWDVKVYVIGAGEGSEDFRINYERLSRDIDIQHIEETKKIPVFDDDILIDAIFGSGLTRPTKGIFAEVIQRMNNSGALKIAIDIASGLYCDQTSAGNTAFQPDFTVAFQLLKLAMLLPENDINVGEFAMVDIGLDKEFIKREVTQYLYLTEEFIKPLIHHRSKHSHKGTFGKAAIFTGSYGKMGASVLAANGYLRGGGGLLTVMAPHCGYPVLQTAVPEAMFESTGVDYFENVPAKLDDYDAIGFGPGLGTSKETQKSVRRLLEMYNKPMVIDADGLNILSENPELLEIIPAKSILTPHPKEFERLAGKSKNDFTRLRKIQAFAERWNCYLVLKGANTAIATPEGKIYFNSTGNPGMATGGAGDVLTGVITSLLAQGQSPFHAAILGVYLHGLAGDLAKEKVGEVSLIASDITDFLPGAWLLMHE